MGATVSMRLPSAATARSATVSIVVLPAPAGPSMATSGELPATARAASMARSASTVLTAAPIASNGAGVASPIAALTAARSVIFART